MIAPGTKKRWNAPLGAFRRFVVFGFLVAIVVVAFAPSLSAGTIWDDEYLTIRNTHLASWSGIRLLVSTDIWSSSVLEERSGYYRPVASLSYALNRFIAGNSSVAYHAGNVLLHALSAALLLRFLRVRKIATGWRAIAPVMLVATMPLVAEPVSWLAGRYDLLGTMFALVALEANVRRARIWLAPLAFAFAVLSKEPFAALIVLVALDDVLVFKRSALAELPKYAALTLVLAVSFLLRVWADVPPATTLLAQGGVEIVRAYAFALVVFAKLTVNPWDLCFFHTYTPPSIAVTIATLTIASGVLVAAFWSWRRAPSSAARSGILLGVIWFLLMLLPGALTAPTLRIIGDRYAYFPLMGAALALAGLMESSRGRLVSRMLPAVVLALTVAQTFRLESRLQELQSQDAMFNATLARDPDNFTTLSLLGNVLARRGDYAHAEEVLLHARRVAPSSGDIDTALAFVHLRQGRYAEAEADGRQAVAVKPENPRAWVNLASALVDQGKAAPAVDASTRALDVRPHFAEAHFVRAIALLKLGQVDAARDDVVATLAIDPSRADARALMIRLHARSSP